MDNRLQALEYQPDDAVGRRSVGQSTNGYRGRGVVDHQLAREAREMYGLQLLLFNVCGKHRADDSLAVAVDMQAMAAHLSFGTQAGVVKSDLLARYHGYATEYACAKPVQHSKPTAPLPLAKPQTPSEQIPPSLSLSTPQSP